MTTRTFEQWLTEVDRYLLARVGLTHSDLADFNSRDLYDDGVSPEEGATEYLENDDVYAGSGL